MRGAQVRIVMQDYITWLEPARVLFEHVGHKMGEDGELKRYRRAQS